MSVKSVTSSLFLFIFLPITLLAQGSSVVQRLTIEVKPITQIAVNGNPGALFITDTGSGADVLTVSDNSTKYSMLTNLNNMKIVASINNAMPSGTKLKVKLESSKGLSDGFVDVSNALTPVEVVSALGKGSDLNQTITYSFAADASVGQINSDSRVITLTLTD